MYKFDFLYNCYSLYMDYSEQISHVHGHSYTDSFKMVKNARSIIDPNDGFVEQLQSIESSKYFY